jgi:hypothetical protein
VAPFFNVNIANSLVDVTSVFSLPLYQLLLIIPTMIILIRIKKQYEVLLKVLGIGQFALLSSIFILCLTRDYYVIVLPFAILAGIALLQIVNMFFPSTKQIRLVSIIITSVFVIGIGLYSYLFWTVSRFEYRLIPNSASYSIIRTESNIPILRIPSTYNEFHITTIRNNGIQSSQVKIIIFEENSHIKTIGEEAFYCPNLKEIILPSSLQTIGYHAFFECHELEKVFIPIGVTHIDSRAFASINLTIYCEAESKPDNWDEAWCYMAKEIVWGSSYN